MYLEPPPARTKAIQCGRFKEPYGVFWQFVRHNIIPTSQHSEVPQASCKLLVRMVEDDQNIPFGALIYRSILASASGGDSSKLTFPCLISSLCSRARVPHMDQGPWKTGHGTLNAVNVGKSGTQRGVAFRDHPIPPPPPPSSSPPHGDPIPPPPPPSTPHLPFDISQCDPQLVGLFQHFQTQTQNYMISEFNQLNERLDWMDDRFEHMNERFDESSAQYANMVNMFNRMSHWHNSGAGGAGGASGSGGGPSGGNDTQGGPSDAS